MSIAAHQECHERAWNSVAEFIDSNLKMFSCSKMMDAEPVLMPSVRSWVRRQVMESGNGTEDICIVMVCNCPTAGILTSLQKSFITNFVTNLVADFPMNACCLLVHPNRAGQSEGRTLVGGFAL